MSFWIHRLLTWLTAPLLKLGGLCPGRSRISRVAAVRERRAGCAGGMCPSAPEGVLPSEGAGRAARCAGGEEGRLAFPSACPGAPQPWRRPAAAPSTVAGRGPACEAVHELRKGAAGEKSVNPESAARALALTCHFPLILAKAGIQWCGRGESAWRSKLAISRKREAYALPRSIQRPKGWIPACAGMSGREGGQGRIGKGCPAEGGAHLN